MQRCPSVEDRSYTAANAHDGRSETRASHLIGSIEHTADVHPDERGVIEDLLGVAFAVVDFRVDRVDDF